MKQFHLYGQCIEISEEREAYNQYRVYFSELASDAEQNFCELYEKNESLDDVINHVPEQMTSSVQPAIEICIQKLVNLGLLTYDETRLVSEYGIDEILNNAYLEIYDQYASISMKQEELAAYRTARRENRGRWSGGGFGVQGAIQGAATAGVMNAVSGAGHMLVNGLGSIGTSISSSWQRKKIFNNPDTLNTLSEAVRTAVYSLHYALADCLKKNNISSLAADGSVSDQDAQEAAVILKNSSRIEDRTAALQAMIKAFKLNPYSKEWYIASIKRYGDQKKELEKIGAYFQALHIISEKSNILNEFAEQLSLETEADAKAAASKIHKYQKWIGFEKETEATQKVYQAVADFDLAYRTVDQMEHTTREEAEQSRRELETIEKIEADVDPRNLDSMLAARKRMDRLTSQVAKKHQETLDTAIKKLDTEIRTLDLGLSNGRTYVSSTIEEANHIRPQVQVLIERMNRCKASDHAMDQFLAFRADLAMEAVPTEIKSLYLNEIDAEVHIIQAAPRTAFGKEYKTTEEKEKAEADYSRLKTNINQASTQKDAKTILNDIEHADFSTEAAETLTGELHEKIKTKRKSTRRIYKILLLILAIAGFWMCYHVSEEYPIKTYKLFGYGLVSSQFEIDDHLTMVDGLRNGLLLYGKTISDSLVDGIQAYIAGFDHGLILNLIWLVLGWVWTCIKYMLLMIPRFVVMFLKLLFMKAHILYYPVYLGTSWIMLMFVNKIVKNGEEEEQEETETVDEFKKKLEK